jgi:hypothetical protein
MSIRLNLSQKDINISKIIGMEYHLNIN